MLFVSSAPQAIMRNASVLVDGRTIAAVGPYEQILSAHPEAARAEILDCSRKLVMPGLIDGHNHLCNSHMNLARMFSMDYQNIARHQLITVHDPYGWPSEESLYDISICSALNAVKHGATTVVNCTILPDTAFRAMKRTGLRTILAPQIATSFLLKADQLDGPKSLFKIF